MSPFFLLRLLSILFVFSTGTALAQSLADVLSSLQERLRAVEQGNQMEAYLPSLGGGAVSVPEQNLIEWSGLPGVIFPTDDNLSSLGVEERVALLNQAIEVFRHLCLSFVNLRPEDLERYADQSPQQLMGVAKIGAARSYLGEDFPDLGKADVSNYHAVLSALAQSVSRLRVMGWPFAGKKQTRLFNIGKFSNWKYVNGTETLVTEYTAGSQSCAGFQPIILGGDGAASVWHPPIWEKASNITDRGKMLFESVELRARYNKTVYPDGSHPEELLDVSKVTVYHSDVALFAKVPGRTGDQLGGKVALLARNAWSPANITAVDEPMTWDAGTSDYHVLSVTDNPAATISLENPDISVNLEWFDVLDSTANSNTSRALPSGFTDLKAASILGEFEGFEDSWVQADSNGTFTVLSRRLLALYLPTFLKGLDSGENVIAQENSAKLLRPSSGDARPLLHPVPGLMLGVPLGVGLEGSIPGWIGISPGDRDFHFREIGYSNHSPSMIDFDWYYAPWIAIRFDHAANLRFVGPAQDFHVVYETSRDPVLRGMALPESAPTWEEELDSGWPGQFFAAWDMPRLRQIVSRDFIVDVKPQGQYQNEVKIYRRPTNSNVVDRSPGHLETPVLENLIRTLVFNNPDAVTNAYSAIPEKVCVTEGSTCYQLADSNC